MINFIGFDNIINNFYLRAEKNTLSHAHLIVGPEGIGKSILARIFALKILNKDKDLNYIDIINYRPEKATFGVDEARKIIEEVSKKAFEGDKKVIIIHKANTLTVQAQNALLKTIEDPPYGVFFIILCENLELMLETIRSRCQIYKLTPLNKEEMLRFIETLNITDQNKKVTALAYAEGVPGRAVQILEDEKLMQLRDIIRQSLIELRTNKNYIVDYETKLDNYKDRKNEVLDTYTSLIRDIIIYKELTKKELIINIDMIDAICEISEQISYKKLNLLLKNVEEARINLLSNINYSMVISTMLIEFLEEYA